MRDIDQAHRVSIQACLWLETLLPVMQVRLATKAGLLQEQRAPRRAACSADDGGRLLVGAAVGRRDDDRARVDALRAADALDAVILDSSQGTSSPSLADQSDNPEDALLMPEVFSANAPIH